MILPNKLIAAASLPNLISAKKSRDHNNNNDNHPNTKRMHYAIGLGDGNIQQQDFTNALQLRGNSNKKIRGRDYSLNSPVVKENDNDDNEVKKFHKLLSSPDNNNNNNLVGRTDDAGLKDFLRRGEDRRAAAYSSVTMAHHRQQGQHQSGDNNNLHQSTPFIGPASEDSSWQISFIMVLGLFAVLVGLFIHFSMDPTTDGHSTTTYLRRRKKNRKLAFISPSSYRKKTDEWSEDEEVTENDDNNYGADKERMASVSSTSSSTKNKRTSSNVSPQPPDDPTARLYYNYLSNTGDTNFREQEHRLRRSANHHQSNSACIISNVDPYQSSTSPRANSSTTSTNVVATTGGGMISSRGVDKMDRSPRGSTISRASTMQTSNHAAAAVSFTKPAPLPSLPPLPFDSSGLGSGLEGFTPSSTASPDDGSQHNFEAWAVNNETIPLPGVSLPPNEPAVLRRHLVKPMGPFTPTESFSSMDVVAHAAQSKKNAAVDTNNSSEDMTTPQSTTEDYNYSSPDEVPIGDTSLMMSPSRSQSVPFSSPLRSHPAPFGGEFADLPTPRVDHTTAKKELAKILMAKGKDLLAPPILTDAYDYVNSRQNECRPSISTTEAASTGGTFSGLFHAMPELPLVPMLDHSSGNRHRSGHSDGAPRSVLLEELQLVRMESGVSGPKWGTKANMDDTSPLESGGQSYQHPMFGNEKKAWYEAPDAATAEMKRQETENLEKLRQASESIDPADDPRNSIQHIRTDLTISSDSSSSLSSKITFSELKLEHLIGGGGFGQVWRAKWKGTPVAVKVLTGSAQAAKISKAVLEEFIGEINMVSGMRHPNICLFMGACLDAPNRAIVTELCENGSLWDALRLPLASPYKVADGVTRIAWPLELYEAEQSPPRSSIGDNSYPIAPKGVWPWHLVKRVAAGTARGMCYLHSGNPPVLHRDLKSANILLDESYTAKLADFGLSRLKAVRSGMTGNCGTVQWMAPEVLCSEDYAEPADVYSFGIILWEMLTQECPYEGMTPIQCALAVLNQNHRPVIPGWCPQSFRALIKNCVERDPKSRPTFAQVLQALDALP
jgi:hypothetical protein